MLYLHCFKKLGFEEYKKEENVKQEDGFSVDDIYLVLNL